MMNNRSRVSSGSLVQQMINSGNPSCWIINNMRPIIPEQSFPFINPSSPSSSPHLFSQTPLMTSWLDSHQESPETWSQLLLGGHVGDEEKYGSIVSAPNFQPKKVLENWEDQVMFSSQMAHDHVKQEFSSSSGFLAGHAHDDDDDKIQQASNECHPWNRRVLPTISSPRSCLTTSFRSNNMLDFSNIKEKGQLNQPDNSSECNSTATGAAYKKARVQGSSSPQQSIFKVRKEKLGDRITALHQLVSPFGKTDTASVLLEAIGYIRFLQNQIQALSSPYLAKESGNNRHSAQGDKKTCLFPQDPGQLLNESGIKKRGQEEKQESIDNEPKKDLRSRGLCLVPVSFTMHVGSDNGADFWAPAYGGGFR